MIKPISPLPIEEAQSLASYYADQDEPGAYVRNALEELDILRSDIIDALTGTNDLFLKVSLVQSVDAVASNLRKALK